MVADSKGLLEGGDARIDMGGFLPFGGSGGREQDGEGGSTAISRGNSSSGQCFCFHFSFFLLLLAL